MKKRNHYLLQPHAAAKYEAGQPHIKTGPPTSLQLGSHDPRAFDADKAKVKAFIFSFYSQLPPFISQALKIATRHCRG
ncbi:hypothetical protein Lal_00020365 [Lupinus albus]|nr:hypothetical protein Lal_00020365 [Lupinus albus]